jgi:hypothetical protein
LPNSSLEDDEKEIRDDEDDEPITLKLIFKSVLKVSLN